MADFAVIVGPPEAVSARTPFGMELVMSGAGLAVFCDAGLGVLDLSGAGVVLGTLFERESAASIPSLSPAQAARIVRTRGLDVVESFWGGYVAIIADLAQARVDVLRDPSGVVPACRLEQDGVTIVCSRLDIALDAGFRRPMLDWSCVHQLLAFPNLRGHRTGLKGVEELLPGRRLTFEGGVARLETSLWSPWPYADKSAQILDPVAAAGAVRTAVERSVTGWASVSSPLVVELSGGLDSSIIASCLDQPTVLATFVNFVTPTAEGDERDYARLVAQAAGRTLIERPATAEAVDVARARPGRHPRPASQALLHPIETAFAAVGQDLQARAFFSGLGGDNVFCSSSTSGPAADALLMYGPGREFRQAIHALCLRHNCTLWTALRATLRKAVKAREGISHQPVTEYLSMVAPEPDPPDHPWLAGAPGVLPGKREHVASILLAQGFLDRYEHAQIAPVRFPLLAQPVMEACLRVPTWLSNAGGRNRAVARDAFADRLPKRVLERQTKGGLNAFMGEAFNRNRQRLAEQLVRGWLATAGLVDGKAIAATLETPSPNGAAIARLFYLADVEAWARTWGQT